MILKEIRELADKEHKKKNQKYDGKEYIFHLEGVASVVKEFLSKHPCIEQLITIAYCHDLFEDTDITREELISKTNPFIVDMVERLTDKEGKNRKERHLKTYYLIREKEIASLVKIADRIFNMRYSLKQKSDLGKMYLKEADSFKFALFDPRHNYTQLLWKEYDKLVSELKNNFWKKKGA